MPEVAPHSAACDQALPSPRSLMAARKQAENLNSPMRRRTSPVKMRMPRPARVKLRFPVMARWHLIERGARTPSNPRHPHWHLPCLWYALRTLTQSLTPERRSSLYGRSGTNPAPWRACLPRTQVGHLLRKSSQLMKHSVTRPSKELDSWTQISMLGGARRLLKALQAGPPEAP